MAKKSPALRKIETYFGEFRAAVQDCRMAKEFVAADWMDAYNRLSRLRDRYKKEWPNLTKRERNALVKPFECDTLIKGLLAIRNIGEHVHVKRTDPIQISFPEGHRITIPASVSAMSVFSGRIVPLADTDGRTHRWDHLKPFEEAERRIAAAIERAGA